MPPMTDIRDLIAALKALPPGHPLENLSARGAGLSARGRACRCASAPAGPRLFGPAVVRLPREGGLTFGRWVKQAPYFTALWRDREDSAGLAGWQSFRRRSSMPQSNCFAARWFATAWLLTATIAPCSPQPISFAGDAWLGYVPIRMSDTICVQERLPRRGCGGSDQPDSHLQGSVPANRRNGKAVVRRH